MRCMYVLCVWVQVCVVHHESWDVCQSLPLLCLRQGLCYKSLFTAGLQAPGYPPASALGALELDTATLSGLLFMASEIHTQIFTLYPLSYIQSLCYLFFSEYTLHSLIPLVLNASGFGSTAVMIRPAIGSDVQTSLWALGVFWISRSIW